MNKCNLFGRKFILGVIVVLVIGSITDGNLENLFSSKKAQAAGECIITLVGKQYDVTDLQRTHTKGVIFICGTDMTAVYQGQHGADMKRMQPYLVKTPTPNTTTPKLSGGARDESKDLVNKDDTYRRKFILGVIAVLVIGSGIFGAAKIAGKRNRK